MKSSRITFGLSVLGLLVVAVAYVWWYSRVEGESAHAAVLLGQIQTDTAATAEVSEAKSGLAELSGEESQIESYFVTSAGVAPFLESLQSLGSATGATVQVLSVDAGGTNQVPNLTVSLNITGTFSAVVQAAGAIEYAPYDLVVSSLSLVSSGKNSWQASLTAIVGASNALPQGGSGIATTSSETVPPLPEGVEAQTAPL